MSVAPGNVLRVAATQFRLRPELGFDAFAEHVELVVDRAAGAGAELVVLPELVTTGLLASLPEAHRLTVADMHAAYRNVFPQLTDAYVERLGELAVTKGVWICGGSHWRRAEDSSYRNTGYLAHPDGTVERQDKLHLTPPEEDLGTTPGDDLLVTSIGPARAGVQICADIQFPELSRILARSGAVLVLCPSLTWNRRGAHRVRYGAHARAVENQLYVVSSSLIGSCGVPPAAALHGTGRALVTCPIDRRLGRHDGVLATSASDDEDVAVADLNLELIAEIRADPEPPGLRNARDDLYRRLAAAGEPSR